MMDEILSFAHQFPVVSKRYFYTNPDDRIKFLVRRKWLSGLGITAKFLNNIIFPAVGRIQNISDFDYGSVHNSTFGIGVHHQPNSGIILRSKRQDMISYLAEETIGSWLLFFSDRQISVIVDNTDGPTDTGDVPYYSSCFRKHESTEMIVPNLLIKISDHVYFELLIVLSYDNPKRQQTVYVEEVNMFFSQPAVNDPKRQIWNGMKEIQYPTIPYLSHHAEFNIILLFRLDWRLLVNEEDDIDRQMFLGIQNKLMNRSTELVKFLEVGLLPMLTKAIRHKTEKLTETNYRATTDNCLISMLLMKCIDKDFSDIIFNNSNWSYITKHILSTHIIKTSVQKLFFNK
jgi:hypothetical protein